MFPKWTNSRIPPQVATLCWPACFAELVLLLGHAATGMLFASHLGAERDVFRLQLNGLVLADEQKMAGLSTWWKVNHKGSMKEAASGKNLGQVLHLR